MPTSAPPPPETHKGALFPLKRSLTCPWLARPLRVNAKTLHSSKSRAPFSIRAAGFVRDCSHYKDAVCASPGCRPVPLAQSPPRARIRPCLLKPRPKKLPPPLLPGRASRSNPAPSSARSSTASAFSATTCSASRLIGLMPSSALTATRDNALPAVTFSRPSRSKL